MHYNAEQLVEQISGVFGASVEPTFAALNDFYNKNDHQWKSVRLCQTSGVTLVLGVKVSGDVYNRQVDINRVMNNLSEYIIAERPAPVDDGSYW